MTQSENGGAIVDDAQKAAQLTQTDKTTTATMTYRHSLTK